MAMSVSANRKNKILAKISEFTQCPRAVTLPVCCLLNSIDCYL